MQRFVVKYFNKIKGNTFIVQSVNTMILRVIGIITLFGFTLFLTHNYDPKIIGQYDFIRIFLLVVGSICLLGTDQSILYFTGILKSQGELKKLKEVYLKIIIMILSMCLFTLVLLLLIGEDTVSLFFNDKTSYLLIFKSILLLFFYCITFFNTEVFRALEAIYIAELYRNTFKYLSVIIGAVVLLNIHKETYLVDAFLIGFVILSIISSIMIFKKFKKINNGDLISKNEIFSYKFIFTKSYPMAISAMAVFLLMSFDVLFLKKYKGDATVAYYAVAVKLMTILSMVINTVNVTISTKIAELFSINNEQELKKTLKHSSRLIFFITLPYILLIFMFPEYILNIFGENYIEAKQALLILIMGQGICSFFGVAPIYLNMTGRQHLFQNILIGAVIINFILNKFLIPEYGMNGAAIAFSVSMIFWNLCASVAIYKKDKVKVFLN